MLVYELEQLVTIWMFFHLCEDMLASEKSCISDCRVNKHECERREVASGVCIQTESRWKRASSVLRKYLPVFVDYNHKKTSR